MEQPNYLLGEHEVPRLSVITDHLAVGRMDARHDEDYPFVLTIMTDAELSRFQEPLYIPGKVVMQIPLADQEDTITVEHIHRAMNFFQSVRESGQRLLIHCYRGRRRSATFAVAALAALPVDFPRAIQLVLKARPVADPRPGNLRMVAEYMLARGLQN